MTESLEPFGVKLTYYGQLVQVATPSWEWIPADLDVRVTCYCSEKKWRQRGTGPAFIKYDSGAVWYQLSVVRQFVSDCKAKR